MKTTITLSQDDIKEAVTLFVKQRLAKVVAKKDVRLDISAGYDDRWGATAGSVTASVELPES